MPLFAETDPKVRFAMRKVFPLGLVWCAFRRRKQVPLLAVGGRRVHGDEGSDGRGHNLTHSGGSTSQSFCLMFQPEPLKAEFAPLLFLPQTWLWVWHRGPGRGEEMKGDEAWAVKYPAGFIQEEKTFRMGMCPLCVFHLSLWPGSSAMVLMAAVPSVCSFVCRD